MKTYTRLLLAILISGAFTACGGGGGGSDSGGPAPVNNAPTISAEFPSPTRVNDVFSFAPVASDPDGDTLTYSVENLPVWLAFDSSTGELSGTPVVEDISVYEEIVVSVSDGEASVSLAPFSLTVMHELVGRENIVPDSAATVVEMGDTLEVVGNTEIMVGDMVTELNNANLQFEFDEEGKLIDLTGVTDLPSELTENLSLDASVQAIIGLYTGAEINANPDIGPDSTPGILLREDFLYLVYFIDAGVNLTVSLGDGEDEEISLGVGPNANVYIVSDPTDPFFYYFGSLIAGDVGFGYSLGRNIPFEPIEIPDTPVELAPLEGFDTGETVLKGTFPFGFFGPFSFFEHVGTAVCSPPQLIGCGKPSPSDLLLGLGGAIFLDGGVEESQQFKVGMNGSTAFSVSLLGFLDLFEYHLFDTSATVDIGTDFQQLAILGVVDPEESSQPAWIPFGIPEVDTLMTASVFANMETDYFADPTQPDGVGVDVTGGDFGISLYGMIDSSFPQARLEGGIEVDTNGLTMFGSIDDSVNPITVAATVTSEQTEASIEFGYDINANINAVIDTGLDIAVDEVNDAFEELEQAIGDFDLAVSLNGLRAGIPTAVDNAISILDAVPGRVRSSVYSGVLTGIQNSSYRHTVPNPLYPAIGPRYSVDVTLQATSFVNETSIANSAANSAEATARTRVNTEIANLNALKDLAQQADDAQFREGLKQALLSAADRATFSQTVSRSTTINFQYLGITVFTRTLTYGATLNYTVLDSATESMLRTAAANVDNIGPAETFRISSQDFYDAIPKENVIEEMRTQVENNRVDLPSFDGAGYVRTSSMADTVFVILDGERIDIDFNPLDPVGSIENIGSLIATQLLAD